MIRSKMEVLRFDPNKPFVRPVDPAEKNTEPERGVQETWKSETFEVTYFPQKLLI